MNWRTFLLIALVSSLRAGTAEDAIELARHARADGIPQAALHDLREALAEAKGGERRALAIEMARCLLDADRGVEAVAVLEQFEPTPEVVFWLAQAQAQAGNPRGALENYRKVAGMGDPELAADAVYGSAQMLDALGRSEEAIARYDTVTGRWRNAARLDAAALLITLGKLDEARDRLELVESPNRRDADYLRYLEGRLALEVGDESVASTAFSNFGPRNRRLAAGAVIGEADADLRAGNPAAAERRLEAFIQQNPRTPWLGELFAKMQEVREHRADPSNAALKRWENDRENGQRSAYATFYLARSDEASGRTDRAIRTYQEFLAQHREHPLRSEATVRLVGLLLRERRLEDAVRALEGSELAATDSNVRGRLRFVRAGTHYLAGNYASAAQHFIRSAEYNPELEVVASANAALCAMLAGDEPLAERMVAKLRESSPELAARLELERAFLAAAAGNPDSGEELAWLADRATDRSMRSAALMALAEWRWEQGDLRGARQELRRVSNQNPQKGYFSVFAADDGSEAAADQVAEEARRFLTSNPDSPHKPDVLMKWGEVLGRKGDFRGARVKFEEAARATSDPSQRRSALFLAARSAARSMSPDQLQEALLLYEEVATGDDHTLAPQARLEQATLQSALGRPDDAVRLLDNVIASTKDPRIRFAAMLKKGETLAAGDAKQTADAIKVFEAVAADEAARPAERNEALTRVAEANVKLDDFDAALAAYYEVLNAPRDDQPEYFWYYKAGFDAARLLKDRDRFKEAAAILEKMAEVDGPRAEEAREQVKSLRLQNFIWED